MNYFLFLGENMDLKEITPIKEKLKKMELKNEEEIPKIKMEIGDFKQKVDKIEQNLNQLIKNMENKK